MNPNIAFPNVWWTRSLISSSTEWTNNTSSLTENLTAAVSCFYSNTITLTLLVHVEAKSYWGSNVCQSFPDDGALSSVTSYSRVSDVLKQVPRLQSWTSHSILTEAGAFAGLQHSQYVVKYLVTDHLS